MKLSKYGFIVRADGYSQDNHIATLESNSFSTKIIGVSSLEEAFIAADYLISTGVELIELCGGFNSHDYQLVIEHIHCAIPVGCVQFTVAEQEKLDSLLNL
jgi:hypothetical protein